jgi:hypothetical protein
LEDEIEAQRQKLVTELKKSGKGTPVTPETFAAWKERKRKIKQDAAKKMVQAELRKKKGGKGLSILSGRDLYEYKKDLFDKVDDDDYDGGSDNEDLVVPKLVNEGMQNGIIPEEKTDLFLNGNDEDLDDLDDD